MRRRVALASLSALALSLSACGSSKTQNPTGAPTVSLWVNSTAQDYRQVAAGAKLALAEAGGHAGVFRINYAGRQVSDDAATATATADALNNARTSLKDTQASAVVTSLSPAQAKPTIFLLNSAGISTVALGDAALKSDACSDGSDIYPSGHPTAIVVEDTSVPRAFASRFHTHLGFTPTSDAYRSYTGVRSVLSSIAAAGVATSDSPPRLNRDALAAQLVRAHGDC
jgi:hypothetical protein